MKAAYINQTGSPDVIQYGDLPDLEIMPGKVLIEVAAVSVNPIDTYIRNGANYWPLPSPFIIGCDFAGKILAIGEGVTGFEVGQRVWGSNQGLMGRQGTFAQLCLVSPEWLYHAAESVSDEILAAGALVGITAHLGLCREAQLKPGETLYVTGGTGGVGSMVVQIAKAIGARVITTAGSPEKADRCRALGADHVINYKQQDIAEGIRQVAPEGVNVFWETLREPNFDTAVQSMAERGRMILMAGRDARPAFPVGPFYVKGCQLRGVVMFKATPEEQRQAASDLNHWFSTGQVRPSIDRVMPLSQAAEAHRLQEASTVHKSGALSGKLVLQP